MERQDVEENESGTTERPQCGRLVRRNNVVIEGTSVDHVELSMTLMCTTIGPTLLLLVLLLHCVTLVGAQDSDGTKLCSAAEMINVNTCCECTPPTPSPAARIVTRIATRCRLEIGILFCSLGHLGCCARSRASPPPLFALRAPSRRRILRG